MEDRLDFGRSERCLSALLGRDGLLFNGESHGTGPSDSHCTRRDLDGSQDEQTGCGSMSMKPVTRIRRMVEWLKPSRRSKVCKEEQRNE